MQQIIKDVINNRKLKKNVFSKPIDKLIIKTVGLLFVKDGEIYMQFETFMKDGKAIHKNIAISNCIDTITSMIENEYNQTDIITISGSCNILRSKKGKIHIVNNIINSDSVEIKTHNKTKNRLLDGKEKFLYELGISDINGRVNDKRQAKFKQINRFLELVDDISPDDDNLTIYDLCCGKSYLTFAVYHYFTEIKNRNLTMYGVDLKCEVIDKCNEIAEKIGYHGLKFICADVNEYIIETTPDIVISLHACDIATDIVLAKAIRSNAKIILSTPCCHHEMSKQIVSDELKFITQYGILKQKLCDTATDALRCKRLEIEGYKVEAVELIDPDETPKNVMIRAVKHKRQLSEAQISKLKKEYDDACRLLNVEPYLNKILV